MTNAPVYEIAGVELDAPLINAAGSINGTNKYAIAREVTVLAETGIGAITVGSFTVGAQEGNEAQYGSPVDYYDAEAGAMYNSMGLPNIGLTAATQMAPYLSNLAHEEGKPIIYSGSPSGPQFGGSIRQATTLAYELLDTEVDFVELNVSCPNIVTEGGDRKPIMGYDLETMDSLLEALDVEIGKNQDIGIKLPPYISEEQEALVPELAKMLRASNIFKFIVVSNTIPGQVAKNSSGRPILTVPRGEGGMSGPATKEVGRHQLELWYPEVKKHMDVVSALGVDSGQEIAARLELGAVAASGVSFLWNSLNWKNAVSDMLTGYAETL